MRSSDVHGTIRALPIDSGPPRRKGISTCAAFAIGMACLVAGASSTVVAQEDGAFADAFVPPDRAKELDPQGHCEPNNQTVTFSGVLQGRLSLTGDIYNKRTEDILLALPIPDMVGRSAPYTNAGAVENKGWELALGWQDAVGEVNYGLDFNLSDNRNKVLDLNGTGPYVSGERVVMEGQPMNSWYGLEADGYFRTQEEADAHPQPSGWITRPGDLRFIDQNDDGVINEDDRVILGNPNPRFMFGVNLNAAWRGFDAGMFFQGVGKRDQYLALGFIQGPVWENYTSDWHNSYYDPAKDNQDARHPTWYANYNRNYYTTNSHWQLDGSFVKLRNAQIGYSMPSAVTDRLGTQRMRVYVTAKNLWMHQNLGIGLDPEYSAVRGDYYPQTRVFSIGTDISF